MTELVCDYCRKRPAIVPVEGGKRTVCLQCTHYFVPCQKCETLINDDSGLIFQAPHTIGWCEKPECYEGSLMQCNTCGRWAMPEQGELSKDGL